MEGGRAQRRASYEAVHRRGRGAALARLAAAFPRGWAPAAPVAPPPAGARRRAARRLPAAAGLEQRLSRLAGWVLAAERAGAFYGLRLPGLELTPGRGDAHAGACLQALALYESK